MAKKYKFKLEALLKLRKANEERIKIEVGELNGEIQSRRDRIREIENEVDIGYRSQESLASSGTMGRNFQFYPMYFDGKRGEREKLENEIYALNLKYERKIKELNHARGHLKVVEKLKAKDLEQFKKLMNKKETEEIEELNNIFKRTTLYEG